MLVSVFHNFKVSTAHVPFKYKDELVEALEKDGRPYTIGYTNYEKTLCLPSMQMELEL